MVSVVRAYVAVGVALLVYAAALLVALDAVRGRLRARGAAATGAPASRSRRAVARAILAAGALQTLVVAYAWIEPYRHEVTHIAIESAKLAPGATVRIVHLSDLHCDPAPRLELRLPAIVEALAPDVIVFTGDAVNSSEGLPVFRDCISKIARLAPTFAVRGNWDQWWFRSLDLYGGTGVRTLGGRAEKVDVRSTPVWFVGADVDGEYAADEAVPAVDSAALSVFLHHFPAAVETARERGMDIHLAGDTHGGQMYLPILGELVRIYRWGIWYPTGLTRVGSTWLYVNRGIGMEGGRAPRVRLCSRPEVAVIEIRSSAPAP